VPRLTRNQHGTTIAEIVIAVAIIGVGLVALSAAIPVASYGIHEGDHLSTATFLANERLEQVRNATWQAATPPSPGAPIVPAVDNLGVSASSTTVPVGDLGVTFPDESPVAGPYTGYSRSVRITNCGASAGCNGIAHDELRQVTVTVTYRPMTGAGVSPTGTTKPVTVATYIARR
jgi:type II secretory pathway pseudopilin PulG